MARLLLVDDNDDLRVLLAESLTDAGHEVTEAAHGRAAIAKLNAGAIFDAVITDVVMPEGDGAEVLAAMRRLERRPQVVVMSGGGQIEPTRYLQMARVLGADAVLQKPFPPSKLIALLAGLLTVRPPAPPA